MRLQSILVVALALVFGGSAAVGVRSFVNSRGPSAPKSDTVPVVVALIDIARGGTITSDLISTRDYPKNMVPHGALTKLEEAIDRAVSIPLLKNEPLLDAKLSPRGAGRGLAALVPKGMRAVTIQTPNIASGVAGFVMPGNKVDVLLTVNDSSNDDNTGGGSTTTLLQNVEILAVDQRIDAPSDNKVDVKELRSVTLLASPHQANMLDLGQNKGTLHLSLRNQEDHEDANAQPATMLGIRFRQEKPTSWDEKAKGVLGVLGKILARRPTPAQVAPPAQVATPAPAPVPAPVVAARPPAPPQARKLTIYRGLYQPSYQSVDQFGNGSPRAEGLTESENDSDGAEGPAPKASRNLQARGTLSGRIP